MRLDPRTKLLILAVTSVSVFMNKSIAVECVLAGIPLVLLSVSGNLKRMLKYAAFFLALLLIQLFIVPRLPVTFAESSICLQCISASFFPVLCWAAF